MYREAVTDALYVLSDCMIVPKTPLCSRCGHAVASCSYADPPSLDILRSAYVPSAPDEAALMSDLASIDAAVASIDEEITTIMERLAHSPPMRAWLSCGRVGFSKDIA